MTAPEHKSEKTTIKEPDSYVQQIIWKRLKSFQPATKGRYRIRNAAGSESIGHYFPEEGNMKARYFIPMDFDGPITYWAELNS